MAPRTSLDAAALRACIAAYAGALRTHRECIDALNVYPVPDGDTGTNMSLTLDTVVGELELVGDDLADVCRALAHGSLMGARGNSGVILSQILRGMCEIIGPAPAIDGPLLAQALQSGATAAYTAVLRPVEGTILTVAREAAAGAHDAAAHGGDLAAVAAGAKAAGARALAGTPDQLAVLRDAGVVDAGGTGLLLLCDAILHVVVGCPLPEPAETGAGGTARGRHAAGAGAGAIADLRYEVMFFLHAPDDRVAAFKEAWLDIGDSIVVVGGDGLYNCHIHTDDIGAAIEAAIAVGRPAKIRITDLREEVEERDWVRAAAVPPAAVAAHVTTAVVAVGVGDGVVRLLRSLGAHEVVAGGQSMNPSTADLLAAVQRVHASGVVILPNNKNIVPVAEQVRSQVDVPVRVVPTRSVVEGLAALVAYDPEALVDENHSAMQLAAEAVVAGELTRAVRDAKSAAGPIREGDHIGLTRDGIVSVAHDAVDAATGLLARIIQADHEILTMIVGKDASADETATIAAWLEASHPDIEVEVHHGGQPFYAYEFGVE
jgi:hypothetical protein